MSETEGFLIIDSHNAAAIGCNYKANEAARPCPQIMARRKLSDISNLPQKGRLSIQEQKSQSIPTTTKEYIEQLQKENLALANMLAHRNKIIEQSGIELERLRLNLIKMRDQNRQLALSHTLMLAEINSGKDRLKALQHELGCKSGLLQARSKLEVFNLQKEKLIEEEEPSKEGEDLKKPRNAKRRLRSLSLGSSEHSQSEDNAAIRPSVRRQSCRLKAVESDSDSLSETDSTFLIRSLPDGTVPSTSVDALAKSEDHATTRPFVRRQSARFKAAKPCPSPDETVQEKDSTSVETSVMNEGNDVQRPSLRRQSIRCKAKRSIRENDLLEMNDTVSLNCSSLDEPVPENGSTNVDTSVKIEAPVPRPSARRQSTVFKAKRSKQADDHLEMDGTSSPKCSSLNEPVQENGPTSMETSVKNEDNRSCSDRRSECRESGKPSMGRPSRAAARKVQSYKEIPLSVKMRRPE